MLPILEQPAPRSPDRETGPLPAPPAPDVPLVLLLGASALLLLALGWPVLAAWGTAYVQPESDYGYGPIVPALAGLMLWHRRESLRAAGMRPCYGALLLLLPAAALLVSPRSGRSPRWHRSHFW